LIETLLEETIKAYELNAALLAILRPPVKEETLISSKGIPIEVAKEGTKYSVASVFAFMLAVGLAHFMLVVGGFTGENGYAKLELVQRWYAELMTSFQ
jgi:heme oxygenase (biliverdin-producing, ferredoxin)